MIITLLWMCINVSSKMKYRIFLYQILLLVPSLWHKNAEITSYIGSWFFKDSHVIISGGHLEVEKSMFLIKRGEFLSQILNLGISFIVSICKTNILNFVSWFTNTIIKLEHRVSSTNVENYRYLLFKEL